MLLAARGRIQGEISRQLFTALAELEAISMQAGTSLTATTLNGAERRFRRVVQVVASSEGVNVPRARTTLHGRDIDHVRLGRGDAVLFALPDDPLPPGSRVTVGRQRFEVVGISRFAFVEDHVLYKEVGLRRISPRATGRVRGRIRQVGTRSLASRVEVGAG